MKRYSILYSFLVVYMFPSAPNKCWSRKGKDFGKYYGGGDFNPPKMKIINFDTFFKNVNFANFFLKKGKSYKLAPI